MRRPLQPDDAFSAAEPAVLHGVAPLDFRRADPISAARLHDYRLMHASLATKLDMSLSIYLRTHCQVNLVDIKEVTFGEVAAGLSTPNCLLTVDWAALRSRAVIQFDHAIVYPALEIVLGVSEGSQPPQDRVITEIEQTLLRGFFQIVLEELNRCWSVASDADLSIRSLVTEPRLLTLMSQGEPVLEISLGVKIGPNSGLMRIVLSSLAADRICQRTDQPDSQKTFAQEPARQGQILRLIGPAVLDLEARLSGAGLTVRDLLELEPGDLLAFNHPIDQPVDLMVEGVSRFAGKVRLSGNRRVLSIESRTESRERKC